MQIPLNAVRAFVAVYETGGIRAAGRALDVTHSAVARHVQELEAAIGRPLLERSSNRRSLQFTQTGEVFGQSAQAALDQLDRAWRTAKEPRPANAVTLSTTPSFASLWLLPRLSRFSEDHPAIQVSVLADQIRRTPLEEGSDIAIRMGTLRAGEQGVPLMDDALCPVASPQFLNRHWGQRRRDRSVEDIRGLPLLHDRDPNAGWDVWGRMFLDEKSELVHGPRFTSSDLVLRAARQGQGVALARMRLAADDIECGSLVPLFAGQYVRLQSAYWIISAAPENSETRWAVAKVVDWLRDEAGKQSPHLIG